MSTLTRERDIMKTKVSNLEQEVEKIRKLSHSLREERDTLRKKVRGVEYKQWFSSARYFDNIFAILAVQAISFQQLTF